MTLRRLPLLAIVGTITVLGLVACSSSDNQASSEDVERQARLYTLSTEICVSREANAGPMTVTFRNSSKSQGNGPFNLDYLQCGETSESDAHEVLRLDIADASGTKVLYMGAANPELGYPKMTVESLVDKGKDTHTFKEGESYTYNVGPYSVKVERQPDTATAKSLRVWVSKP